MARFAPDGEMIFYGAAWDGKPVELFAMQYETSDSRPLGVAGRVLGDIGMGRMLSVFNRFDHWQVGYVFPKGLYQLIRAQGLDVIASLLGLVPSAMQPTDQRQSRFDNCSAGTRLTRRSPRS